MKQPEVYLSFLILVSPDGPLPGGRAPPAAQDDLHAVLRPERDARDPLSQVREPGAAAEGKRGAQGIGRRTFAHPRRSCLNTLACHPDFPRGEGDGQTWLRNRIASCTWNFIRP